MGYAILRAEPRTVQGAVAMLGHALRETTPANAIDGAPAPEVLAGVSSTGQGMAKVREAIEAAKAAHKWQKSVKPVLDVLVTFSHKDGETMTDAKQADYFRRALEFVQERFGGADNVLTAAVHRDESTAHVQILMLARERDGVKLGASQYMGNRGNLHKLQDDFWEACGKPFGLQRGERRTGAKNLPVRQLYSALAAGAEVPELVQVPEVSMKDRILAPEKLAQRDKAIKHNADAIEQLRAQAKRGQSLHPQLMAEQAQRYRQAVAYADMANQKAQEAVKRGNEAIAQAREVAKQLQDLQTQYSAKSDQVKRLDADIDRLRKMRDRENGPSR
jgi:hypothetical protein